MADHDIKSDSRSNRGSSVEDHSDANQAPPPYSEVLGLISDSNDNMGTNAAVGNDGRVNITINQKSGKVSNFFSHAFKPSDKHDVETSEPYIPPSLGGKPGQVPPPCLNVVIQVVGSRGDVQPFVALGKVLKETYGHRVRLATHPVFKDFVQQNGLEFFSIGGDPAELMAFMVKNPGLMPGKDAMRSGDIGKRRRNIAEMIKGCWRSCYEAGDGSGSPQTDQTVEQWLGTSLNPETTPPDAYAAAQAAPFVADCIIANPPSFAHIHIAERLGIPMHIMFTMPWSPTKAFPHPLANIVSSNAEPSITNYWSYLLVDMLTWQGLGDVINRFRVQDLGLEPMSLMWAPGTLHRLKVPHTYCWSPALIPKPTDWLPHLSVSGFYFLSLASNFTPDNDLAEFLNAGPPPVYIGFGSIVVDDPNAMTKLIFDAVKATGQRALVSKGWGGFGADQLGIPDSVYMLGNVPHDWLFQKVSCVVHHGGAGTTAAGISCGRPTVIVPFFGDQPWWGAMVAKAGAGPEPIPHQDLTAEKLADAIKFALKPESLARAKELSERVSQENGNQKGAQSFHRMLPLDRMRCALFPDRAAVFRVKRTKILLSTKAAYVLYMHKMLTWDNLKMHRPQEYEADIGPTDPILGGAGAILGTVGQAMMGFVDMPVEILKLLPDGEAKEKMKSKARRLSDQSKAKPENKNSKEVKKTSSSQDSTSSLQRRPSNNPLTLVASPSALTPSTSSTYLNPGETSTAADTSTIASMTTATSTEFEPMSPLSSSPGSGLQTPIQSPPNSPSPTMKDKDLKAGESLPKARGRPHSASMADAMSALKDSSASPGRFRKKSESPGSSRESGRSRTNSFSRLRSGSGSSSVKHNPLEGAGPYTLDTLYGTSKGVSRIVGAGLRSPMDFTMAISKGFHNLPRLYGEEPRQVSRVTDVGSGIRTAGKEFGRGIFDGITGLVTQPISGAKKEGASGFLKGFGRGIAGVVVKPSAAAYALPAYAMMGVYKSIQKHLGESTASYILSGRIAQGFAEWSETSEVDQNEAIEKWHQILNEVKLKKGLGPPKPGKKENEDHLYAIKSFVDKQKDKRRQKNGEAPGKSSGKDRLSSSPSHLGVPASTNINQVSSPSLTPIPKEKEKGKPATALGYESDDDEQELEEAIRLSLMADEHHAQSHPGDDPSQPPPPSYDDDAELRRALTNSLDEMRKADEEHEEDLFLAKHASKMQAMEEDRDAIRNAEQRHTEDLARALEESKRYAGKRVGSTVDDDEDLKKALAESSKAGAEHNEDPALRKAMEESLKLHHGDHDEDHEDLKKAIEESKRAEAEEARKRREEEIILEYVKKQSLAEDNFKRKKGESSTQ